ncbi:beta-lactamase [Colletotrichum godetiae]|uniref:Beta-lactamase n=1 Tax=Colletotrichum godetiae TaxID=1209918 RepID=A0AAJ0AZE7_9PEZI|nr:beta-lactamase [Colletotrichum godetiae]KAK1701045.1 beta-lactamase [Colletotrichum godetiae]
MRTSLPLLTTPSLLALAHLATATPYQCPPLGAVLPAAKFPSTHPSVRAAVATFLAALEAETAAYNASAISIGVSSAFETVGTEPLVDFHFTPRDRDALGAQAVDRDTVYRLASVSKVFPVLAALQRDDVLRWDESVVKYIPELGEGTVGRSKVEYVDWGDVSVEAAAVHYAGVGADMMTDGAAYSGDWKSLGLPPVSEEEKPKCGGFLGVQSCSREEFLDAMKNRRPPVYPAFQTPVYSNLGTTLVGMAVEGATGKPFEEVLFESILRPAGMSNTTYGKLPANLETMFIPANDTEWFNFNLGALNPAGGLYSTTADMLRFGDAVLQNRLLSPAKTRRWLKPSVFTSAPGQFVGAPWEGILSDNVTADGRLVEMYTKGGDLILYHAGLALVPEHGITMSILVAGPEVSAAAFSYYTLKMNEFLPPLLRALDEAARDEAKARIAGTYADEVSNSTLTISLDDGWGLLLEDWYMKGFDVVPNLARYSFLGVNLTDLPPATGRTARLYPTGLEEGNVTAWRAVFDTFTAEQRDVIDDMFFFPNASCVSWLSMDRTTYNYKGLDHFEFTYGDDGRVESVLPKPFKLSLKRVD